MYTLVMYMYTLVMYLKYMRTCTCHCFPSGDLDWMLGWLDCLAARVRLSICSTSRPSSLLFSYRVLTSKYSERRSSSFSIVHLMTQNFPKLTMMTEVRKNSTETTTFSKLSARKMSKQKISAKANTPKRRLRSQKICDADIEVSAEAEVPVLRKLQNLPQCDRGP